MFWASWSVNFNNLLQNNIMELYQLLMWTGFLSEPFSLQIEFSWLHLSVLQISDYNLHYLHTEMNPHLSTACVQSLESINQGSLFMHCSRSCKQGLSLLAKMLICNIFSHRPRSWYEKRRLMCNVFFHRLRPCNLKICYICDIFSHWLRPSLHDLKQYIENELWQIMGITLAPLPLNITFRPAHLKTQSRKCMERFY